MDQTVIWRRDARMVATGFDYVRVNATLLSPCSILRENAADDTKQTETLIRMCDGLYNRYFLDELAIFCKPTKPEPTNNDRSMERRTTNSPNIVKRQKRFIVCLAVIGIIGLLAWSGYQGYKIMNMGTEVSELDELTSDIINKLEKVEQQLIATQDNLHRMKDDIVHVIEDLAMITGQMDIIREETVLISYIIGQITSKFIEAKSVLRKTAKRWKDGKFYEGFFDFLQIRLNCGDHPCPMNLARPVLCKLSPENTTMFMEFIIPKVDPQKVLFNAVPFEMAFINKEKVCTMEYAGPQQLILMEDKCAVVPSHVQDHKEDFVLAPYERCNMSSERAVKKDQTKAFLNKHKIKECVKTEDTDWEYLTQVKMCETFYWIYCPRQEIILTDTKKVIKCPDSKLIRLPITKSFSIGDRYWEGQLTEVTVENDDYVDWDPIWLHKNRPYLELPYNLTHIEQQLENITEAPHVDIESLKEAEALLGEKLADWLISGQSLAAAAIAAVLATGACFCCVWKNKRTRRPTLPGPQPLGVYAVPGVPQLIPQQLNNMRGRESDPMELSEDDSGEYLPPGAGVINSPGLRRAERNHGVNLIAGSSGNFEYN